MRRSGRSTRMMDRPLPGIRETLAAGICLAAWLGSPALGQDLPPLPGSVAPPAGPVSDQGVYVTPPPMVAMPPGAGLSGGGPVPGQVYCDCGDRRGFARWHHHKTQCKRHLQEHFLGYLEEFNEWPLGKTVEGHSRTQVGNAQAARMVFYQYDFVTGTAQLNLKGREKLQRIQRALPTTFYPVFVEWTPQEPGLDEARRLAVVTELASGNFPVPAERVLVSSPLTRGLSGQEAVSAYGRQVNAFYTSGVSTGVPGFGGGAAGAGFDNAGMTGGGLVGGIGVGR